MFHHRPPPNLLFAFIIVLPDFEAVPYGVLAFPVAPGVKKLGVPDWLTRGLKGALGVEKGCGDEAMLFAGVPKIGTAGEAIAAAKLYPEDDGVPWLGVLPPNWKTGVAGCCEFGWDGAALPNLKLEGNDGFPKEKEEVAAGCWLAVNGEEEGCCKAFEPKLKFGVLSFLKLGKVALQFPKSRGVEAAFSASTLLSFFSSLTFDIPGAGESFGFAENKEPNGGMVDDVDGWSTLD